MALGSLSRPVVGLLALLQLGAACAVVAITALHMANVDIRSVDSILHQKVCLLTDNDNTAICFYTYALGAVSLVFTFFIGLLQICTCNVCGCGAIMDSVFAVVAAGWWVVGAFIVSSNSTRANRAGRPSREWREAVAWLCWIGAMLFGAMFAVHVVRVISKFCTCSRRRRSGEGDAEEALPGAAKPRSAALELGKEVRGRAYLAGTGAPSLQQQFIGGARNI